jgi:AcrR family transcriptional regulator
MSGKTGTRVRRPVERAREEILDAAERHLVAGGPGAVRVQAVAREIGISDAAVHYHFGSRDGLLRALLRRSGRRLREAFAGTVDRWEPETMAVGELAELLRQVYSDWQYARMTAWLSLAGWTPAGSGLLRAQAEAVHRRRLEVAAPRRGGSAPDLEDTQFCLALLNLVSWSEPLIGEPILQMVGVPADQAGGDRFRRWVVGLVATHLRSR